MLSNTICMYFVDVDLLMQTLPKIIRFTFSWVKLQILIHHWISRILLFQLVKIKLVLKLKIRGKTDKKKTLDSNLNNVWFACLYMLALW